jgi:hypothetical protein
MDKFLKYVNRPILLYTKFNWLTYTFIPVSLIIILRNGINFIGYDYYGIDWARKWPKPISVYSVENSGDLILAKLFSTYSRVSWMVLHLALTLLLFVLVFLYCSFERIPIKQKQTLFLLIFASPLTMLVFQEIGWHDVVTIIGALILAFGKNTPSRILGILIMCSGNTPQAMVASFLFGCLLNVIEHYNQKINFKLFIPFIFSIIIWIFERFWLGSTGREGELLEPSFWLYSVKGFLIASPLYLYALLGPIWFIAPDIWKMLKIFPKKQTLIIIIILVLIPGGFGIITTDSSRDALCIMSPLVLWFFRYIVVELQLILRQTQKIALILMPCFLVYRQGEIIPPWSILERFFF